MAQFKFTVLLMPNGPLRITGGPFDQDVVNSSHTLEDPDLKVCRTCQEISTSTSSKNDCCYFHVKALLASSATRKNKKKKKKVTEESKPRTH